MATVLDWHSDCDYEYIWSPISLGHRSKLYIWHSECWAQFRCRAQWKKAEYSSKFDSLYIYITFGGFPYAHTELPWPVSQSVRRSLWCFQLISRWWRWAGGIYMYHGHGTITVWIYKHIFPNHFLHPVHSLHVAANIVCTCCFLLTIFTLLPWYCAGFFSLPGTFLPPLARYCKYVLDIFQLKL